MKIALSAKRVRQNAQNAQVVKYLLSLHQLVTHVQMELMQAIKGYAVALLQIQISVEATSANSHFSVSLALIRIAVSVLETMAQSAKFAKKTLRQTFQKTVSAHAQQTSATSWINLARRVTLVHQDATFAAIQYLVMNASQVACLEPHNVCSVPFLATT